MKSNPDILGKYIHKKIRSHYIELKADGTYLLFEGSTITGTFEVNGSEITINGAESTSVGKIKNGVIIDSEGDKWVRASATPAKKDDPLDSMTWLPAALRRNDFPWELVDLACLLLIFVLAWLFAR